MKIFVKQLLGKECVVDITPSDSVLTLKHKVSGLLGVEVPQQRLLIMGKTLADENPISFYPGIREGSRLNLLINKKAKEDSSIGKLCPDRGMRLLTSETSRVLRHYYTESETESIVNELMKNLKNEVNNLNYCDLERLATALLQDQENIA